MNELTLHPNVYATGHSKGLVSILERCWVRETPPGDGTMYIISGFANYNGGVRFFETFRQHVQRGGEVFALFSGSTSARLTSRQVVQELLECGARVCVINRKRLLHAKCYGSKNSRGEQLVVTSGNFTGPGMSQNVELSVLLEPASTHAMGFSWETMLQQIRQQEWNFYEPTLADLSSPAWQLLYDEQAADIALEETDEVTMVLKLSHADTVRINAAPGSTEGKGTQYFWLSKDCYDFFPALTIRNARGHKATYSCLVKMRYVDLGVEDPECRVTYEAENNLDFRLGTGKLRHTRIAQEGDYAAITRVGDASYELRILRAGSEGAGKLAPYAVHFIGHRGKQYGYIANPDFEHQLEIRVGAGADRAARRPTR